MFLGEYQLNFNGKGRLILPKKLRQDLGGNEIILTRGFEGCIWGFSREKFEEEAKKQLEISATEERARMLRRYIFSSSVPTELDNQGRFVIPAVLLGYANLNEEVVLIGAGDHFEVWEKDLWKKHLAIIERDYGKLS